MAVLFIPFMDRENNRNLIGMAASWQAAHAVHDPQFGQVENRIYRPNQRVLEDIQREEIVHILAHGQGSDYIVNDIVPTMVRDIFGQQVGTNAVLDAAMLASRVRESGLMLKHRTLRLSVCNTNGTMDRFAKAFLTEMVFLGYSPELKVFYYASSVSVPSRLGGDGPVVQQVVFLGSANYVDTPSGLAPTHRRLPAETLMYQA